MHLSLIHVRHETAFVCQLSQGNSLQWGRETTPSHCHCKRCASLNHAAWLLHWHDCTDSCTSCLSRAPSLRQMLNSCCGHATMGLLTHVNLTCKYSPGNPRLYTGPSRASKEECRHELFFFFFVVFIWTQYSDRMQSQNPQLVSVFTPVRMGIKVEPMFHLVKRFFVFLFF